MASGFIYDAQGNIFGTVNRSPDGSIPNCIPCTDAQAATPWAYRIDLGSGSPTVVALSTAASLQNHVTRLAASIDGTVSNVYSGFTRFQQEYTTREAAAQAFKTANYQGDPGIWVTSFATSAALTNQVAADTILSQANTLNTALANLAAQRMRKYEVLSAKDDAMALATYADIMNNIGTIAAALA